MHPFARRERLCLPASILFYPSDQMKQALNAPITAAYLHGDLLEGQIVIWTRVSSAFPRVGIMAVPFDFAVPMAVAMEVPEVLLPMGEGPSSVSAHFH